MRYVKTQATTTSRPFGWLGRRRRRGVVTWLNITSGNIAESEIDAIGKVRILKKSFFVYLDTFANFGGGIEIKKRQ